MLGLKISTEFKMERVEIKEPLHDGIKEELNGYMERVRPKRLKRPYCMIVDEDGLLKQLPINIIGSYLYETDKHMHPIVGDIIIMREEDSYQGPYVTGLREEDFPDLENTMGKLIKTYKKHVESGGNIQ